MSLLSARHGDISLKTIYRGIFPFIAADVVRLAVLIAFPALVLTLPQLAR